LAEEPAHGEDAEEVLTSGDVRLWRESSQM
jgi:hypothetical protein